MNRIFVEQYDSRILITTTMTVVLGKSIVKQALRELIQEEPALFKKC